MIDQTREEGELILYRTANETVRAEFYNRDAIISVGYRVNSAQATQFRIWATQRIREIRASERRTSASCRPRLKIQAKA